MEWLGWAAAVVLVITLFSQVKKNWEEKKLKGVNPLLYYGQAVASLCFALYSLSINSWVFVVTNALGFLSALVGIYLVHRYR
ncbi:MAG TPA: PQ-loop domain-containing transporter [Blastocatellia bacterium]|nr:PQ-loop domain-containing transporter [Blastocatellia bacterium]